MKEDEKSVFQKYIEYVDDVIKRYKSIGELIGSEDSDLDPSSINRAMVDLYPVSTGLLSEYQRAKSAHCQLQRSFDRWWDPLFDKAKRDVIHYYASIEVKGVKPSVTEYTSRARMDNADEYYRRVQELDMAEAQVAFLQRMLNRMDSYDKILVALSNNCRSDMYRLSIGPRANAAAEKSKVRATRSA